MAERSLEKLDPSFHLLRSKRMGSVSCDDAGSCCKVLCTRCFVIQYRSCETNDSNLWAKHWHVSDDDMKHTAVAKLSLIDLAVFYA